MKLTHKLFHRMTNRSCKLQGCSLIYTGMAKDLDVPVLSLTLGTWMYTAIIVDCIAIFPLVIIANRGRNIIFYTVCRKDQQSLFIYCSYLHLRAHFDR